MIEQNLCEHSAVQSKRSNRALAMCQARSYVKDYKEEMLLIASKVLL